MRSPSMKKCWMNTGRGDDSTEAPPPPPRPPRAPAALVGNPPPLPDSSEAVLLGPCSSPSSGLDIGPGLLARRRPLLDDFWHPDVLEEGGDELEGVLVGGDGQRHHTDVHTGLVGTPAAVRGGVGTLVKHH
mmetsp:Transcript_52441/g.131804  ORF Transcript_52441/g.131804 Transcript_52441/m.131804 type:complete len:131 (+) Transcript_52441:235-627(+)